MSSITLSYDEIRELTGGHITAGNQLKELHRQGFVRARRAGTGRVVLERAHYEAVCAGNRFPPAAESSTITHLEPCRARHAKRARAIAERTPKWADRAAIRFIYAEARRWTKQTGVEHHVDHEIPLQGVLVSGLHVHNNLRVMIGVVNVRKSNRFKVD